MASEDLPMTETDQQNNSYQAVKLSELDLPSSGVENQNEGIGAKNAEDETMSEDVSPSSNAILYEPEKLKVA